MGANDKQGGKRGGNGRAAERWSELATACVPLARAALTESILPFWWRSIDAAHGGVFNCWNNAGTQLLSRDKFTWSQGRFAWLWSRLAEITSRGLLPGSAERFLAHAERTAAFLEHHAFLRDGRCAFLLAEDGAVKELEPGAGAAPSIYADCFVAMGLAECARASGKRSPLDRAWALAADIRRRVSTGDVPTHPYPIPAGYESHGLAMILLNVALVLEDACDHLHDARLDAARALTIQSAARIFDQFMLPGGRIIELRRAGGADPGDCLLDRHLNPGHALEGTWMLLTVALRIGRDDWTARAIEAVRFALERGWDEEEGGIMLYADCAGGAPRGSIGDGAYESAVRTNWATKLWWVHSESLYATLLAYRISGDETLRIWFWRIWEYAFGVFPQPDAAIGEWIQIRDRGGKPLERVVALPVKDPYHIARNLIQVLELCAETPAIRSPGSSVV